MWGIQRISELEKWQLDNLLIDHLVTGLGSDHKTEKVSSSPVKGAGDLRTPVH